MAEEKELREEIAELKASIKELQKHQANAYKDLDDEERATKSASEKKQDKIKRDDKRKIERDINKTKRRSERSIHAEPLEETSPLKPIKVVKPVRIVKPVRPPRPARPARPVSPRAFKGFEGRINFESEDFKDSLKDFTKRVEKAAKEGEKVAKEITDKLTKKIQKALEKENERLREAVDISTEEYEEIIDKIEDFRTEIDDAQQNIDEERATLIEAQREMGMAKRRMERAYQEGDRELQREAKEKLREATEELQDARDDIRDAKNELTHAKREFARLQRRAAKIHEAQSKNGGSRVIRVDDVDLGATFTEYSDRVMSSLAKNLESTIKIAVDGGRKAIRGVATQIEKNGGTIVIEHEGAIDTEEYEELTEKTADLLSALGDKNRLLLLKILENSPQYQKELAEETGLRGGTFKHHTDILQDANFITREAIRGRYLITQLGIEALKLSELIHYRKRQLENYENEDDDTIDIDIED